MLGLLGLPAPSNGDGVDLSVYWHAPETAPRGRFLFAEADHNNERPDMLRMLRVGSNKLLYNRFSGKTELYDLSADAEERNDLAAMQEGQLTALRKRIQAFMAADRPGPAVAPPTPEEIEEPGEAGLRPLTAPRAAEGGLPGEPRRRHPGGDDPASSRGVTPTGSRPAR
jgi:hypothetical protein